LNTNQEQIHKSAPLQSIFSLKLLWNKVSLKHGLKMLFSVTNAVATNHVKLCGQALAY